MDMNQPGYRLHKLSGRDQEVWSVWVNGNWRITFEFLGEDAYLICIMKRKRKPTHPGRIIKEDILKPLNLTVAEAAENLGTTQEALSELIDERSSLSPDMAVRIARATNTSPESWMNMQQRLDLWESEQKNFNIHPFTQSERTALRN